MITALLVVTVLAANPDDPHTPAQSTIEALRPRFGPRRTYNTVWFNDWVTRCQRGHIPRTERYCQCLIGSGRFYWDFKQIKHLTRNLQDGMYVPEQWFDIEAICLRLHETPE
jgi:hypothetical protein